MNKKLLSILAILAVGSLIVGMAIAGRPDDKSANISHSDTRATHDEPSTPSHPDESTAEATMSTHVIIKDLDFSPKKVKVKKGGTVTWTNEDSAKHDIAPDSPSADFPGNGRLLNKGESYTYTFAKVGTYPYHCTPHPFMKATVEVVE